MSDQPQGYWYCPHCQEEIIETRVTYQELHDACGHRVEWIEPVDLDIDKLKQLADLVPELVEVLNLEIKTLDYLERWEKIFVTPASLEFKERHLKAKDVVSKVSALLEEMKS